MGIALPVGETGDQAMRWLSSEVLLLSPAEQAARLHAVALSAVEQAEPGSERQLAAVRATIDTAGADDTTLLQSWLAAVGFTGAALWAALSGDREPGTVPTTGWWTTTFLLATSVAVTSWELYVTLLAVLGALVVLGLGLTAVAQQPRAGAARVPDVRRGSSAVRRPDAG